MIEIITFQAGYNTNIVLIGSTLLGFGAGLVGIFTLLRRRALISDAVSHATLPGIGIGFLCALWLGWNEGRHLPTLLLGAALSGMIGIFCVQWIRQKTRLNEDVAIGTVLSVFYGGGIVILSYIQTLGTGSRAGLDSFLLGQAAAMNQQEAFLIVIASLTVIVATLLFFKELFAVCFDDNFASGSGMPVSAIDLLLMSLMLVIVCIGLKTVGLILIIALLIIPPVSARFWTEKISLMALLSSLFGAFSCFTGTAISAYQPNMPTGSVIVLSAAAIFIVSLLLAPARGIISLKLRKERFAAYHGT